MAILKIEKQKWHDFFDRMSKILVGKSCEIEVDALKIGSQIEAEWVPLMGIVYDPKNDLLSVMIDGLDHIIRQPRTVYADMTGGALSSMEVTDADDFRHIVKLRDTLMLPPPH